MAMEIMMVILFGLQFVNGDVDQCSKEESEPCALDSINLHKNVVLYWKRNVSDDWVQRIKDQIDHTMRQRMRTEMNDGQFGRDDSVGLPAYSAECNFTDHQQSTEERFRFPNGQKIYLQDSTSVPTAGQSVAESSLPCFLYIKQSPMISGSKNRGVFTRVPLPKGLIFGPYVGEQVRYPKGGKYYEKSNYGWSYHTDQNYDYYIDGQNEAKSNWLRFVNSARFEEEQHLIVVPDGLRVFIYTYKNLEPETELLVYYGDILARRYGVEILPAAENRLQPYHFAAKRNDVKCATCQNFPGLI